MSSTMWYIMQSIQSRYSLSERLIRTIAAIRSFPQDNVEDLIRKGADVNRMHGTLKPLHCACMVADADCVELLLEKGAEFHCKIFASMGDERPFVCTAAGCGQSFTNEDHLAVHKHKHEMTLRFGPPRTDSVIIADQTPTPTRFLKNCEEVGLFNELDNSLVHDEDDKRTKSSLPASSSAVDMSLQTLPDVKVKVEESVEVDSSPSSSPDSVSGTSDDRKESQLMGKDSTPRGSAPTPTIVRPGSLPLHLGFDGLQPTMPSPTSVITQAPPSSRTLGSPSSHYPMMMLPSGQAVPVLPGPVQIPSVINLARPMCMVPNIPGIPGPPLGGSSSGSNSPSGYNLHSETKMRLKAALAQQSPSGQSLGVMMTGGSPMVPQRVEQSQVLLQHPDAPSPAQPQVTTPTQTPCQTTPLSSALHPPQVSPAQPTGGRRRRTVDDDPDERRQRFLERNRAAASRCRQKRKLWVNSLEKKAEELSSMNVSLSNEVSLLRNEVAHLKQLLLAHKDCPVTTLQKKNSYLAADEKVTSESTGSPAPVIQHSSLALSPSAVHNGLSARAAAEAMAMSVLAGMGQRTDTGPSHIIMAAQSQSAAR
ncbi:cyclic AMP-dependent transcription factor ATF-7-like isoform X1 [Synchiropus splendidus]|uniref:cyclic AMP-dependent transcription factor ATF-7-like isoform X1 n=2 Tax=Synchiropus splendidus TaxID=270530 RepID=UPI00237EBEC6|nr:cyclic AMP-dependent transcription factor ATF-7-like isoform X1 [Synchiropus splendidus]